jgi:hypothetical protein
MEVPLWNVDREVAGQFVQAVMRNREVNSVTITDESGTVFVHLEKERKPQNNVVSLARDIRLDQKVIGKYWN